jgi:hypothetical protein
MKIIQLIILSIITISMISCTQESSDNPSSENDADRIIRQLSDSVTLGGVIFPTAEEYHNYPKLKIEDMPVLNAQYVENRSGYKILKTPKVVSQGTEGSCLPFTMGYIGVSYLLHTTKGMPYEEIGMMPDTVSSTIENRAIKPKYAIRSPEYIYNGAKIAGDCNAGCYAFTVLQYLKNQGACSWSEMPYSDENGCKSLPTELQKEQAKIGKIKSYGTVLKKADEIKKFIKSGYPVLSALRVDENFIKQTYNAPYIYHSPGGAIKFGHAFAIIGYDDSREVFIAQNSWGESRHDKGYFYLNYGVVASLDLQLYVIKS